MAPKVDFIAQLAGLIAVVYALIALTLGERDVTILVLELIILLWQLGSAIVWTVALRKQKTRARKLTVVVLIAVPVYVATLFSMVLMKAWEPFVIWLFIAWWPLALYYFTLTTMRAFGVGLGKTMAGDVATK
jgi:hypothetical protein